MTATVHAPSPSASPVRELRIGAAVVVGFLGLFVGWAAWAPLNAGAFASGQVSVTGNRKAVQHRDGGIVRKLHVAEGDHVRQGQVLIELDIGDSRAVERGVAGQVYALMAQRARLVAERDKLTTIPRPTLFATLEGEDATLASEAMRLQSSQFEARDVGRAMEGGILRQRIRQLEDRRLGYQRQIASAHEQQRLIEQELTGVRSLAGQGYAPLTRVRALERTAAQLQGEQGRLQAEVSGIGEQIGETELQLAGVSTQLGVDVTEQLRQVEVQLNELEPRLQELRTQIANAVVRSPATGSIVGLAVFTTGGVVGAGQILMEVVPDHAEQVLVARVSPSDIDAVSVGLETEVRFPALRARNLPVVRGRVRRLSADSLTDPTTGETYFRTEVIVPPEQLEKLGASARQIRVGMPTEMVILLRKRSTLEFMIEPLTRSLWLAGKEG